MTMEPMPELPDDILRNLKLNESISDTERELKFRLLDKLGEIREKNGFVQFIYSKYGPGQPPPPLRDFIAVAMHDHAVEYMGKRLKELDADLGAGCYDADEKSQLRAQVTEEVEQEIGAVRSILSTYAPNADRPAADLA